MDGTLILFSIFANVFVMSLNANQFEFKNYTCKSNTYRMLSFHIPIGRNRINCSYNQITILDHLAFASDRNILELNFRSNRIESLPGSLFFALFSLTHLDLSLNKILIVNQGLFNDTTSLRHLNLSCNQIYRVSGDWSHMEHLRFISLAHNRLTRLPSGALRAFLSRNSSRTLRLNSNGFLCGCHLTWLSSVKVASHLDLTNMSDTCRRKDFYSAYNIRDFILKGFGKYSGLSSFKEDCGRFEYDKTINSQSAKSLIDTTILIVFGFMLTVGITLFFSVILMLKRPMDDYNPHCSPHYGAEVNRGPMIGGLAGCVPGDERCSMHEDTQLQTIPAGRLAKRSTIVQDQSKSKVVEGTSQVVGKVIRDEINTD